MEFITNDFLKYFDLENNSESFKNIKEDPESKEIYYQKLKSALNDNLKRIKIKDAIQNYIDKLNSVDEKLIFSMLVFIKSFYNKEIRELMNSQFNECKRFLRSDMCKRNITLKNEILNESDKLKIALKYDLVTVAINSLYDLYTYLYPNEPDVDICVRISEAMRILSIYRSEKSQFKNKEEAQIYLDEKPEIDTYEGKKKIYDRIKKDLIKNRNRFLIR